MPYKRNHFLVYVTIYVKKKCLCTKHFFLYTNIGKKILVFEQKYMFFKTVKMSSLGLRVGRLALPRMGASVSRTAGKGQLVIPAHLIR